MSEQGDKFVKQLFGSDDPLTFRAALAVLRHTAGSGRGAARLAGVGEASLRRYAKNQATPKPETREKIERAAREALYGKTRLPSDEAFTLRAMNVEPRRRNRERERVIKAGKLDLAPGTIENAKRAWIATGDSDAALKAFVKGIGDSFYKRNLNKALPPKQRVRISRDEEHDEIDLPDDYGMVII